MRDLKHLIFFEELLQNADNELVEQEKKAGGLAIGYTCYHIPEVLLNVDKCFSVRLRAPRSGSVDISTYYMSNYSCEYARALLERSIEGGYQFLDGLAGVDACSAMNRFYEHYEMLKCNDKETFFVTHVDVPFKVEDYSVTQYAKQMRIRLLDVMEKNLGVDTSDDAIRAAVDQHNEVCKIMQEISEMRKTDNPIITGYEFHILNLVSYTCPKKQILPYLKETLEELKNREADVKPSFRARIAVVGSEIDDPEFTKMIEEAGGLVVSDRYCFGSKPGREIIELNDEDPVLEQICRHYMTSSECARYISDEKVNQRRETANALAKEFNADGIIYEQMKFCDFWAFERALASHILNDEYGWPVLSIDRPYNAKSSGQLRTRFQAFVESLEIKKIHKRMGGNV